MMYRPGFTNREWFIVLLFGLPAMFLGMYFGAPTEPAEPGLLVVAEQYKQTGRAQEAPPTDEQLAASRRLVEETPFFTPAAHDRNSRWGVAAIGGIFVIVVAAMVGWIWYE